MNLPPNPHAQQSDAAARANFPLGAARHAGRCAPPPTSCLEMATDVAKLQRGCTREVAVRRELHDTLTASLPFVATSVMLHPKTPS